jgi:crotonobetainyl-CoA:carnitine CoA-transferase CaiB-like acyl-CoA transferase
VARSIANPVRLAENPIVYRLPPPLLGVHTRSILGELGLGGADLEAALTRTQ